MNLNVAATQGAACGVTVTHGDAKGVGVFSGLTVVANIDLETVRSVSVDCRCTKDLRAVSGHRNGGDGGTFYGPAESAVILISQVTAWSAVLYLRSETKRSLPAKHVDPATTGDLRARSAWRR